MSTTTRSPLRDANSSSRPLPVMRVTPYDRVSSFLLAAVVELSDRAAEQAQQLLAQEETGGVVLQYYPPETEALLAEAERSYAHRAERDIRRTYFVIVPRGDGFAFAVTRQTYWR